MSGQIVVLAALFLAGTGAAGCTPEPTASAAEQQATVQHTAVQQPAVQQAPVQQPAVEQAAAQQAAGEQIVFSCRLPGGKIVTVTQDGGRFLYRYGAAGRPELTIAGTAANGRLFKRAALHGGVYATQLRFVSGEHSYIVHSFPRSDIVDNVGSSGLRVFRGGRRIMDRNCEPRADFSFEDFEALHALPDIPEGAPSAWGE
jgi:hypothetical protein